MSEVQCTGSRMEANFLVKAVLGWVFVFAAAIGKIAPVRTAHDLAGVVTELSSPPGLARRRP